MEEFAGKTQLAAGDLRHFFGKIMGLGKGLLCRFPKAFSTHSGQIDRSGQRAERLVRADVAGSFFPADMLFSGLQSQNKGAFAVHIGGFAYNPTGDLPEKSVGTGHKA